MARNTLSWIVTTCLGVATLGASAQEATTDAFDAEVGFVSNYVDRGVSKSGDDAAMHGRISYLGSNGLFGAVQGTTVDTLVPGSLDDVGSLELRYTLGYRNQLHADWAWSAAYTYYDYPSAPAAGDIGYGEVLLSASYRDWLTGAVAYSDDILASGEAGTTFELGVVYPTPWGFSVLAGVGYADLGDFYETDYAFGRLGVSKQWGALDFSLLYHDAQDDAAELFGPLADEEIVMQVTAGF